MSNVFIIISFLFLLPFSSSCNYEDGKKQSGSGVTIKNLRTEKFPEIKFNEPEHDFGKVKPGETVGCYFKYKNTGKKPLIITSAHASCGCTVPEFSKEPLAPGQNGYIKVLFDTSGRSGMQSKSITIESNASNNIVILRIKAEIVNE